MTHMAYKSTGLSYLGEIYEEALCLTNDELLAKELTARAYKKVSRRHFPESRDGAKLRARLHHELIKATLYEC